MICAVGFLFEIEKRGYMASGEFVPMVSLDHPEALENLHRDFQHAGSDIVQAFTYNGHREKLAVPVEYAIKSGNETKVIKSNNFFI